MINFIFQNFSSIFNQAEHFNFKKAVTIKQSGGIFCSPVWQQCVKARTDKKMVIQKYEQISQIYENTTQIVKNLARNVLMYAK